jgi:serine/threonine protein kinase
LAVLAVCGALLALYYRRKLKIAVSSGNTAWRRRAKKGIFFTTSKAVTHATTELQHIEVKEKYKPISMSEIASGDEVGHGTFGIVFKCTFRGTRCAIKKLHQKEEKSEAFAKALMDEFDVMSSLHHPNVLLTLGIAEDTVEGTKGIVMELMEASLADVLTSASFEHYSTWDGSLFSITSDVANGMAYIHYSNMLHRDLKPANVLLDAQWVAKISDFGTVFNSNSHRAGEGGGDLQGTPPYMAPEIVKLNVYDKPVDVWAFGCMLAHMGTKRPPYSWLTNIETPKQLVEVVRGGEHSPLELLLESMTTPEAIKELSKLCCQLAPADRPTFDTITGMVTAAIPVGTEPRPVARIRNKRPLRTSVAMDHSRPENPFPSFRDKEMQRRQRSTTAALEKSYQVDVAGASSPGGAGSSMATTEDKPSLYTTFADTILSTFASGTFAAESQGASAPPINEKKVEKPSSVSEAVR